VSNLPQNRYFDTKTYERLEAECESLRQETLSEGVFLFDNYGQLLVSVGEVDAIDPRSLGSLVAGTVSAADGMADLLGEEVFRTQVMEGEDQNICLVRIGEEFTLAVMFTEAVNEGLVRLESKQIRMTLEDIFEENEKRTQGESFDSPFEQLSEDKIGKIVNDAFTNG
jgi:predicted regulator of Ras-like GTPase activity (Roadblock/LC7/MglB family)